MQGIQNEFLRKAPFVMITFQTESKELFKSDISVEMATKSSDPNVTRFKANTKI